MQKATLSRTAFATSRALEFFTESELAAQIGAPAHAWPVALLKELLDNALDACETAGTPPHVTVTVEDDALAVADNGPGLPLETLQQSLDYLVRVSDKRHYIAPTRGQLGNALKCVWAAPFVADGEQGRVEVSAGGKLHTIIVSLDEVQQQPQIAHEVAPGAFIKTGTLIKMHWPRIASSLASETRFSYNTHMPDAAELVRNAALFNPHATIEHNSTRYNASVEGWRKWLPSSPTSAHWYDVEDLAGLLGAYVSNGRDMTVRAFVSQFDGLSSSGKQKTVIDAVDLQRAVLSDLVEDGKVDRETVATLLAAMQQETREVKPARLGTIGEAHFTNWMTAHAHCDADMVEYRKRTGIASGLPYVLEIASGVLQHALSDCGRDVAVGLNWSPSLQVPISELYTMLGEQRVDSGDPVVIAVHLAMPRLTFTDRGKSRLALPDAVLEELETAVRLVTKQWRKVKSQYARQERLEQRQIEDAMKVRRARQWSVKDAAYHVMPEAYRLASSEGRYPANARQVMYAARPLIIDLTGKARPWKHSSYFTQTLLPDFMEELPELTHDWDVVFDNRGKLVEPHAARRDADRQVDLGTLAVRRYIADWRETVPSSEVPHLRQWVDTSGPAHRYQYALFIEKEGFNELLAAANIADRYDLAVMSTKGMSTTAARALVEELTRAGVTTLVVRDFDKSGFAIAHTLCHDTRRYKFDVSPDVVDLGLRLVDVEELQLASEPVTYTSAQDPRQALYLHGATVAECNYLVRGGRARHWRGERVELNAMTSAQFIGWLERRLAAAGVRKVVPEENTLRAAYLQAVRVAKAQAAIDAAMADDVDATQVPVDLQEIVRHSLNNGASHLAWDDVVHQLAEQQLSQRAEL